MQNVSLLIQLHLIQTLSVQVLQLNKNPLKYISTQILPTVIISTLNNSTPFHDQYSFFLPYS